MSEKTKQQSNLKGKLKFIMGALAGAFLFLAPIPTGDGMFNIPLGVGIDWLNGLFRFGTENTQDVRLWLAYAFIVTSFLSTCVAYLVKPKWIMKNEPLKEVLLTTPLYAVTRFVAFAIMTMVILDWGPEWVIHRWDGGGLMVFDLITGLTTIFLLLSFAIPILTDFGLMEFIGILIKKFVNRLFKLPGRASVDLAASWFGSSAVSVIITRDQHEKGFYTGREAATICANFAFVSLPFSLVIANTVGVGSHFAIWYVIICLVCLILGMITPRMFPLKQLPDTYLEGVEVQIDEEVESGESRFVKAMAKASERALKTTIGDCVLGGLKGWLTAFMDLFPVIVAWGTIALVIHFNTPIFDWISWPMGWMLALFNVPGGAMYAPITVIGFIDMFLPAIFLGADTYFETRFILGALSIVQIVYMAETGVLILKSKIPLGLGKLFIVFMIRTVLGLPLIILLTHLALLLNLI